MIYILSFRSEWKSKDLLYDVNFYLFRGIIKNQIKSVTKQTYIPLAKVVSDIDIRFVSISRFPQQDLSRFIPPAILIATMKDSFRASNEYHIVESLNILEGDCLLPRFALTFDEKVVIFDRENSEHIEPPQIIKRKVILDFLLVGRKDGFSFREFKMNSDSYNHRMEYL